MTPWAVCTLTHSSLAHHQLSPAGFSSFAPRQNKLICSALCLSSVPAHVEMMGFLGIGNNPMVGCTVACAVDVATALNK